MGWANCGEDSRGRPIGYAHEGTCDEPGCEAKIDRGLAYKCGKMHGEGEDWCEGYFCEKHLFFNILASGESAFICKECEKLVPMCPECDDYLGDCSCGKEAT